MSSYTAHGSSLAFAKPLAGLAEGIACRAKTRAGIILTNARALRWRHAAVRSAAAAESHLGLRQTTPQRKSNDDTAEPAAYAHFYLYKHSFPGYEDFNANLIPMLVGHTGSGFTRMRDCGAQVQICGRGSGFFEVVARVDGQAVWGELGVPLMLAVTATGVERVACLLAALEEAVEQLANAERQSHLYALERGLPLFPLFQPALFSDEIEGLPPVRRLMHRWCRPYAELRPECSAVEWSFQRLQSIPSDEAADKFVRECLWLAATAFITGSDATWWDEDRDGL